MTADALKKLKTAEAEKISHIDYFKIAISVDCVIFGFEKIAEKARFLIF